MNTETLNTLENILAGLLEASECYRALTGDLYEETDRDIGEMSGEEKLIATYTAYQTARKTAKLLNMINEQVETRLAELEALTEEAYKAELAELAK